MQQFRSYVSKLISSSKMSKKKKQVTFPRLLLVSGCFGTQDSLLFPLLKSWADTVFLLSVVRQMFIVAQQTQSYWIQVWLCLTLQYFIIHITPLKVCTTNVSRLYCSPLIAGAGAGGGGILRGSSFSFTASGKNTSFLVLFLRLCRLETAKRRKRVYLSKFGHLDFFLCFQWVATYLSRRRLMLTGDQVVPPPALLEQGSGPCTYWSAGPESDGQLQVRQIKVKQLQPE